MHVKSMAERFGWIIVVLTMAMPQPCLGERKSSQALGDYGAGMTGRVKACLDEPVTDRTRRLTVLLSESLRRARPSHAVFLPQGTKLLCRVQSYDARHGHLLVTCYSAIRPEAQGILPLMNVYLSHTTDSVGLQVIPSRQKQFILPKGHEVWAVFNNHLLLDHPEGD